MIDISFFHDIIKVMNKLNTFKALAHPTRLLILKLLKTPTQSFKAYNGLNKDEVGICVQEMQLVLDISQSTTSQHLSLLHEAGLLTSKKIGKFTYFKRNEENIKAIGQFISEDL